MDTVFLHGLKCKAIIGARDWEKRVRRNLLIDLDMGLDLRPAAASDELEKTVNYSEVSRRVTALVGESRLDLLEALAEQIADLLLTDFPLQWCRVRINKPYAVSGVPQVGVLIERCASSETRYSGA